MTFAGQECRPGFYLIEGSGGGGTNPAVDAATAVNNQYGPLSLGGFSEALTWVGTEAQDIQPGTSRSALVFHSAPIVGGVADDNPVPPQDSMLIEWLTVLKGGKGKFARRGRTYLPGIYSTGQISGFLIPDLYDALSAFASALYDAFIADGTAYAMHAVAFVPDTNPRQIQEVNPIATFAVDNVVAIQRSRRPGRGI
jgi:hypothetical protein